MYDADADGSGLCVCVCVCSVHIYISKLHLSSSASTKLIFSIATFVKFAKSVMIIYVIYTTNVVFRAQQSTIQKQFYSIFQN